MLSTLRLLLFQLIYEKLHIPWLVSSLQNTPMLDSKASLTRENKRFAFLSSFATDWKLGNLSLISIKVSLHRRNESSINSFVLLAMNLNRSLNVRSLNLN